MKQSVARFNSIPLSTRRLLGLGAVLALFIALPLFIWGVVTQTFNIREKAQETQRVSVSTEGAPYLGPITAPITMVEFGDFECPFCKNFHDLTLQPLLDAYPDKIRFVFRNFPLVQLHPNAEISAEAALCANEQDKYWQMSDLLFANQGNLSSENLKSLAITLGLDATQFNSCLDSSKYSQIIEQDIVEGTSYGVLGTPTFFINGILVSGAQPLDAFKQIIDQELAPVDDVFFIPDQTSIAFTDLDVNPRVSVSPAEIQAGKTYAVNVNFQLQNTLKEGYPNATSEATLTINNLFVGKTQIDIPLIAAHRDGAGYSISASFTATSSNTNLTLTFDPNTTYIESNRNNNSLSFSFGQTPTPTPTPSPTESPTPTGTPNFCGGTCGSNYNCQGGLYCYQGFCRNPDCPNEASCGCKTPTPTAKPKLSLKTTPTPKVIYYPGNTEPIATTPSPSPKLSPIPVPELTTPAKSSLNPVAIGITAFMAGVVIFAISVLLGAFKKKDKITEINFPPQVQ